MRSIKRKFRSSVTGAVARKGFDKGSLGFKIRRASIVLDKYPLSCRIHI